MIHRELFPDPRDTHVSLEQFLVLHMHDQHPSIFLDFIERAALTQENVLEFHAISHSRWSKWMNHALDLEGFRAGPWWWRHHHLGYGENLRLAIFAADQPKKEET